MRLHLRNGRAGRSEVAGLHQRPREAGRGARARCFPPKCPEISGSSGGMVTAWPGQAETSTTCGSTTPREWATLNCHVRSKRLQLVTTDQCQRCNEEGQASEADETRLGLVAFGIQLAADSQCKGYSRPRGHDSGSNRGVLPGAN